MDYYHKLTQQNQILANQIEQARIENSKVIQENHTVRGDYSKSAQKWTTKKGKGGKI
jgi:ribosomal protein L16/L10AE